MLGLGRLARRIFGSENDRLTKPFFKRVEKMNALEPQIKKLSDQALRGKTSEFRERLAKGAALDDILDEAFAVVREAGVRVLGQRHFDVQLVGGMVLHSGRISEMKTGEGKTLVATLPVYLNALTSKGVHVVTVNDYLARRDAGWMGRIYSFLGMTTGCIVHGLTDDQRRQQYACDVTYGTNNEYGFDYLRDNMKYALSSMVQRGHHFAIVDEVDSILIDEARTPLIISGPTEDLSALYRTIDTAIPQLEDGHFELDEKNRQVTLTEAGNDMIEVWLHDAGMLTEGSLYDAQNIGLVHHVSQALKAHKLFQKDRDYIVKDSKVIIIDEFTGRMMEGRRYSDGLHQALEAKESAAIQPENVTLASITFQNYFRLYGKLAGMTGTAATEAAEFHDIYKLVVVEIPTNALVARKDHHDEVYRTADEKNDAITKLIDECQKRSQPVLVGTVSIEKSEVLSRHLKQHKIPHNVLNARYHEFEAQIIAQAGVPGAVTIATNMAGRGTDIQLGGNLDMRVATDTKGMADGPEKDRKIDEIRAEIAEAKRKTLAAGGLYVIGTERHESRRIDNQLRGRSGRQGDPGASKFFLSLQDDLMRIFGSDRMDTILQRLGLEQGEAIIHPWVNKALEKAQQKVEARNFDIRKNLLKFDNVVNDQRKTIFEQRIELMRQADVADTIVDMRHQVIEDLVTKHIPESAYAEKWDVKGLEEEYRRIFDVDTPVADWAREEGMADQELRERLTRATDARAAERASQIGPDVMRQIEKSVLLQVIDHLWREHLVNLDHLRQYVGLRGYAQRDPLNEYKSEAFEMFQTMLNRLRQDVTRNLMTLRVQMEPPKRLEDRPLPPMQAHHINPLTGEDEMADPMTPPVGAMLRGATQGPARTAPVAGGPGGPHGGPVGPHGGQRVTPSPTDPQTWGKVPRNSPCPCGSGKKFKHCHGVVTA